MVKEDYRQKFRKLEENPNEYNLVERVELLAKMLGVQTISYRRYVSPQTLYSDLKDLNKILGVVA